MQTVGTEEGSLTIKQRRTQQLRTAWTLRYFANRYSKDPRESPVYVHEAAKGVQRAMRTTQNDDNIKSCVLFLLKEGYLEPVSTGEAGEKTAYRLSREGWKKWERSRECLSILLFDIP